MMPYYGGFRRKPSTVNLLAGAAIALMVVAGAARMLIDWLLARLAG